MLAVASAVEQAAVEPYWDVDECTCDMDPGQPKPFPEPTLCPWYVRTEGLMFTRQVFGIIRTSPTNIESLAGSLLDQPFRGGGVSLVGRRLGDRPFAIEARTVPWLNGTPRRW